ncbi:hypothetical protein AAFF_G00347080 [Aldrovandia affinis]|uniref:Uncharacterized protein n=1 Tax=Aldrovandia affinis TaxID=143900 RepID=A0AAD7SK60_9TELE|nr:hypothetical protein AAFF_G00347080 [Aldrovandia affinis]
MPRLKTARGHGYSKAAGKGTMEKGFVELARLSDPNRPPESQGCQPCASVLIQRPRQQAADGTIPVVKS